MVSLSFWFKNKFHNRFGVWRALSAYRTFDGCLSMLEHFTAFNALFHFVN